MKEDLFVLGAPSPRTDSERRIVRILVLLGIVAGSVVLGAKRDPLLTWIIWGIVGVVWAGRDLRLGRVSRAGAVATFASFVVVGAGLSVAAYGVSHCSGGGFWTTDDGRRLGVFCSARATESLYIVAGLVIALPAIASVPSVRRRKGSPGSLRDFDLGAALAFLVALGMSLISLEGVLFNLAHPLWASWFLVTCLAAWVGFRAWKRKRWLVAAGAFFLSIAWPGGLFVELNIPISFALCLVSLVRAWRDRPARMLHRER